MHKKRRFTNEFKKSIVQEILSGTLTVGAASRKYELAYQLIKNWQKEYELGHLDNESPSETGLEERTKQLEQMVGKLTMENEFLKKALKFARSQREQKERLLKSTGNSSGASEGGVK